MAAAAACKGTDEGLACSTRGVRCSPGGGIDGVRWEQQEAWNGRDDARRSGSALLRDISHRAQIQAQPVRAAFATQGIRLRTLRRLRGGRVIVLFDPRWRAPRGYHYRHSGKQPSATQFLVFVHANAGSGGYRVEDGNLWVDNGQGLGPKVDAALPKLHQISGP